MANKTLSIRETIEGLEAMAKALEEYIENLKLRDDGPYAKNRDVCRSAIEHCARLEGLEK